MTRLQEFQSYTDAREMPHYFYGCFQEPTCPEIEGIFLHALSLDHWSDGLYLRDGMTLGEVRHVTVAGLGWWDPEADTTEAVGVIRRMYHTTTNEVLEAGLVEVGDVLYVATVDGDTFTVQRPVLAGDALSLSEAFHELLEHHGLEYTHAAHFT